jgi:GntR family transcriptional regulator of vanillate catabolism
VSGGSYAVRELCERDICDAIEMRGVVEGTAARLAAERGASPLALARARQYLGQIDATVAPGNRTPVDVERYLELNASFHAQVSALAESFVVERTCQRVAALPFASPNAFVTAQVELDDVWRVFTVAQDQHRSLLDAIEARQGTRAEAIAREHARVSLLTLRSVLRTRTGMERVAGFHLVLLAGSA